MPGFKPAKAMVIRLATLHMAHFRIVLLIVDRFLQVFSPWTQATSSNLKNPLDGFGYPYIVSSWDVSLTRVLYSSRSPIAASQYSGSHPLRWAKVVVWDFLARCIWMYGNFNVCNHSGNRVWSNIASDRFSVNVLRVRFFFARGARNRLYLSTATNRRIRRQHYHHCSHRAVQRYACP